MSIVSRLFKLFNESRRAKQESGVGHLRQLIHILSLAQSPSRLGPAEYFEYRLFDRALSFQTKGQFLGYKTEGIYSKLNQPSWHGTANDKILFEQVMIASGLAIPKTIAIYHPWRVAGPYCQHVRTRDDLEHFLNDNQNFPIFVKPVHGLFGRGANTICAYDAQEKMVIMHNNSKMSLAEFHHWVESNTRVGMLFQNMLLPSSEVQRVCGKRLSSVRMIVLCDEYGPQLFRANWKLCTGNNLVDNTEGWTNGNIVAAVDHTTGLIQAAYRGIEGDKIAIDEHPDTHVRLVDLKVPNWEAMKDYVENAARAFPGLRFQAWDIAATTNGICAIELNLATLHTVYATQLVSNRGFLDDKLVRALKAFT